jgi:hypothetical protein
MAVSRPRPRDSHEGINSKAFCKVTPSCSADGYQDFGETCFLHIRINDSRSLKMDAVYSFDTLLLICKPIWCRIPDKCNVALTWLVGRSKVYKHQLCCMECGVTRARQISSDMRMETVNATQEVRQWQKLHAITLFALDWQLGNTMLVRKSVFGLGQRFA